MSEYTFLRSLFDFRFVSFVTTRWIKFVYVLSFIFTGLFWLMSVIVAFQLSTTLGVLTLLIIGPLGFILSLIYWRLLMEFFVAFFRIHDQLNVIAQKMTETPVSAMTAAQG